MQVVNLFPQFSRFWETAGHRAFGRQAEYWHEMYCIPNQKYLQPYLERWTKQPHDLERAMLRYPKSIAIMHDLSSRLTALADQLAPKAAKYCDSVLDLDVIILTGLYIRPIVTLREDKRLTAMVFLEAFDGVEHADVLLVRGLISSFLSARNSPETKTGPLEDLSIGANLACTGFGILGSQRILPGLPPHEYIVLSGAPQAYEWWKWCLDHEQELARRIIPLLPAETQAGYEQFFGNTAVIGRSNTGWYLGWRVLNELYSRHGEREVLTAVTGNDWSHRCQEILTRLASSPHSPLPAPKVWVMPTR